MPEIKPVLEHPFLSIPGWFTLAEGFELQRSASLPGFGEVVEIGSFKGRSTCFLASGVKSRAEGTVLHAVDHFRGSSEMQSSGKNPQVDFSSGFGTTYSDFAANIHRFGFDENIIVHCGRSHKVAKTWNGVIRLLFIDGEHEYSALELDCAAWLPFMHTDGIVVFHDYADPSWPEVAQFVDTLTFKKRTLIDSMLVCEL